MSTDEMKLWISIRETRRLSDQKLERLKKILKEGEDLLVAFSGGLDSSFLAKVATDLLGEKALCVTLDTEAMPRSELLQAREMAKSLSLNHRVVTCSIFDDEDIAKNPPDRCYICNLNSGFLNNHVNLDRNTNFHLFEDCSLFF